MELKEKIQVRLIGTRYRGEEETKDILNRMTGKSFELKESCIDDGADGDETEDSYVMKDRYEGQGMTVRIYYGNVSGEIGYVNVSEE